MGKFQKAWNWNTIPHPPSLPLIPVSAKNIEHMEALISMVTWSLLTQPLFSNKRLRSYWLKGRKFRCQANPQDLMSSFAKSLDNFIDVASRRNKTEADNFLPWRAKLLQTLREKCDVLFQDEDSPNHLFLSKAGLDELRRIIRTWSSHMLTSQPITSCYAVNLCTSTCSGKRYMVHIMSQQG